MLPNLLLECIQDFETQIDEPDLLLPTADQTLKNLERQDFEMSPWIKKLNTDLRDEVTFDFHPTNSQLLLVDIQTTRSCEFWIRNGDLVRFKLKPTNEQPSLNTTLYLLFSHKSTH